MLLAILALIISPTFATADLSPNAPTNSFEMAIEQVVRIDGDAGSMSLVSFHESSQNWVLFFRHATADVSPYDNLKLTFTCNGQTSSPINTTQYDQWVDDGILSIEFPYDDLNYPVTYNERDFTGKYSRCDIMIEDYNASSYLGNNTGSYTGLTVEMIPFLSVIEFVNCTGESFVEIGITNELSGIVTMMTDAWSIAWVIYSIFIVVFAVFMIPIFVFILIRWAIFRITGYRLIERKDRGDISA